MALRINARPAQQRAHDRRPCRLGESTAIYQIALGERSNGGFVGDVRAAPVRPLGVLAAVHKDTLEGRAGVAAHGEMMALPPRDERRRALAHGGGALLVCRGRKRHRGEHRAAAFEVRGEEVEVELRAAGDERGGFAGERGGAELQLGGEFREREREAFPRRAQQLGRALSSAASLSSTASSGFSRRAASRAQLAKK